MVVMRGIAMAGTGWRMGVLDCTEEIHGSHCPLSQVSNAWGEWIGETYGRGYSNSRHDVE
jgi:hypothetical protein